MIGAAAGADPSAAGSGRLLSDWIVISLDPSDGRRKTPPSVFISRS
jgi:hypothetical protein